MCYMRQWTAANKKEKCTSCEQKKYENYGTFSINSTTSDSNISINTTISNSNTTITDANSNISTYQYLMITPMNSCNDVDGMCEVIGQLQNMSTADDNVSICANCGKEGSDVNNICNKCKQVKYCNAACKKKHRHKHKKECERRTAELHDEQLFKQPPLLHGDCPICFLLLPTLETGWRYQTCCGKMICSGCIHAPVYDNLGNKINNRKCPFCRIPTPDTDEDLVKRTMKRVEANDPIATYDLGNNHRDGEDGYPQDYAKALELYHRAAELGYSEANVCIGYAFDYGEGVEQDKKKANHYYELAAMRGDSQARYNLGNNEGRAGNMERSSKHYMIAARSGNPSSLQQIKYMYSKGHATKEDYTKALQLYQAYLGEIKSAQRDKAAADHEDYRYY